MKYAHVRATSGARDEYACLYVTLLINANVTR